jgi:hypothetical protein
MSKVEDIVKVRCRACGSSVGHGYGDDLARQICGYCITQPLGKHLLARDAMQKSATSASRVVIDGKVLEPKAFTPAEKSMIRRLWTLMPAQQLLDILNDRLQADRGEAVVLHTMAQLEEEIGPAMPRPERPGDWAGMKKLLAHAARQGILGRISEQVIEDFAVVWSLNSKQVVTLKDIVLAAKEG